LIVPADDSHAALMDRIYRRQRHIYDFTRKYYLFGRDRLIDGLELKPGARVLEVGCGTARNLVRIAKRRPDVRLYGLDASSQMLVAAEHALAGYQRVKLVHAYAEDLSPSLFGETEAFDVILFSYSLSMIPDWKAALHAASEALAPLGSLNIVDFGDLKGLAPLIESSLRAWLGLFHVAPRDELLAALERHFGAQDGLVLLPGRYAFALSCKAEKLQSKSF
jgi:S-adenosylmethionine-diacylgycerolhomoserine-N-methlytransferase